MGQLNVVNRAGNWCVEHPHAAEPFARLDSLDAALAEARRLGRRRGDGAIVVFRLDGGQERHSVRSSPLRALRPAMMNP